MSNAKEKIKEIATKEQKDAMNEMLRMADKSKVDEVKQMLEYTQKGTANSLVCSVSAEGGISVISGSENTVR